jgi:hypothetical protein
MELCLAKRSDVARKALCLRLEGLHILLPAVLLHVIRKRYTDEMTDATETEESGVTLSSGNASRGGKIDEDVWVPAADRPPELRQFKRAAGSYDVTKKTMDQASMIEDRGCWRSLDVDRKVGQHAALCVGK